MTNDTKRTQLTRTNTIYWLVALFVPAAMQLGIHAFTAGAIRFPVTVITPLLLVGLLVASNRLIGEAFTCSFEDSRQRS